MKLKNIMKIKDLDKLKAKLPGLIKEAKFHAKSLEIDPSHKGAYQHQLGEALKKIRYINSKVVNTTTYPVILRRARLSGYSARALGVSTRDLRNGNVDPARCDALKVDINDMIDASKDPREIRTYVEMTYYEDTTNTVN